MNKRVLMYILGGILIGIGLGIGWFLFDNLGADFSGSTGGEDIEIDATVGSRAPDFTLEDVDGNLVTLSDLRGRVVLLNFWATWCGPCRVEMPTLQAKFEEHAPDLAVLAVDFDEPKEQVQAFAKEFELTFDVLLDPGAEIQTLYLVRGYPSSVFVDEEGIVKIIHIGIMTEGQLAGYLSELGLAE